MANKTRAKGTAPAPFMAAKAPTQKEIFTNLIWSYLQDGPTSEKVFAKALDIADALDRHALLGAYIQVYLYEEKPRDLAGIWSDVIDKAFSCVDFVELGKRVFVDLEESQGKTGDQDQEQEATD